MSLLNFANFFFGGGGGLQYITSSSLIALLTGLSLFANEELSPSGTLQRSASHTSPISYDVSAVRL